MKTFRYRLYPTQEQADAIRRTAGCVRYVYNGLLNDYKAQYNEWKKNGRFYVVILTDCPSETIRNEVSLDNLNIVGLDMSYSKFCVDSDSTEDDTKPKYVRWYRNAERKRNRLARRLSKKEKGSSNREKACRRLAAFDAHTAT